MSKRNPTSLSVSRRRAKGNKNMNDPKIVTRKRKLLAEQLAKMSEDERDEWSLQVMQEITDRHVVALDMGGFAIVPQSEVASTSTPRTDGWPYDSSKTGYNCPHWCWGEDN
jgi:hypothetical protein